jgi:hypothetical protein
MAAVQNGKPAKKRPRGRPKSARGTPEIRKFRCHDDEWNIIKRAAKQAKKPTGTYVRESTLGAARDLLGMPKGERESPRPESA